MNIKMLYDKFLASRKVTTDSRDCPAGSIFFALRGPRFNGNNFAVEALRSGCSLAVVDDKSMRDTPGCLLVEDALLTLQELATLHRRETGASIIGITGSNGKTTTKELMAAVLSRKFNTWHTMGNLNNHVGVPLTLLAMPVSTEIAVIEMGANHVGEIAELSQVCKPDHGLITNVGKAHIEGFGSFEGVKRAKSELYNFLERNNGTIFMNGDNPHLIEMTGKGAGKVFRYGKEPWFEVTWRDALTSPLLSLEWKYNGSAWFALHTNLPGLYNLENVLAAIAAGCFFGVPAWEINMAISHYNPSNQRSQIIKTNYNTVLMDAYNANPSSMTAALDNFTSMKGEVKVMILGSMKELGEDSATEHRALISQVKSTGVNTCYLVGEEFAMLQPEEGSAIKWFQSTTGLIGYLESHPLRDALILIKGSRANRLERVLGIL